MSKEEIIAAIRDCADKLGHPPSYPELNRAMRITRRNIRKHFGRYTWALRDCGLDRRSGGHKVEMALLFTDWCGVVRTLGKLPSISEYENHSKYSTKPLLTRFRTWGLVPRGLHRYAEEEGLEDKWGDVLGLIRAHEGMERPGKGYRWRNAPGTKPLIFGDRPVYGAPIARAPLAHSPINEAGVIYLFGALAAQLGFVVTRIQSAFPDCEAMREVEPDVWQRVRVELEFESRNFLKHGHSVKDCDLIVCWLHNWPECPLEVLELKTVVRAG